jgi:hypothetical protein
MSCEASFSNPEDQSALTGFVHTQPHARTMEVMGFAAVRFVDLVRAHRLRVYLSDPLPRLASAAFASPAANSAMPSR